VKYSIFLIIERIARGNVLLFLFHHSVKYFTLIYFYPLQSQIKLACFLAVGTANWPQLQKKEEKITRKTGPLFAMKQFSIKDSEHFKQACVYCPHHAPPSSKQKEIEKNRKTEAIWVQQQSKISTSSAD